MRAVPARRLGLLLTAMLAAVSVGAVTAQAASPVTQETIPVESVFGPSVVDPCSGEVITWTGSVHIMGVMTTDAAGGFVIIGHLNFEGVQGTDSTGTKYTVVWTSNESVIFAPSSPNLPTPNVETQVIRLALIGAGSTPDFYLDVVGHYTITPDGRVAVSFETVNTGCSG